MRGWGVWAAVLVMLGAAGCARNLAPPREIALKYEGPIESRDIVEGGRIYTTLCTACHRGRVNPRGYSWSPGQMRHQIREGNRLMPPLSGELLTDTQVEAVLAYLSVMGALDGELPPSIGGDLDLDEELADEALDDGEPELVGSTDSPELPATTPSTAPSVPPEASEPVPSAAEPTDGPREGATGLAPPSGAPADPSTSAASPGAESERAEPTENPSADSVLDGPAARP